MRFYRGFGLSPVPSGLVPRVPTAPSPIPFTPQLLAAPVLTLVAPPAPPPLVGVPPWIAPAIQDAQAAQAAAQAKAQQDAQMAALRQAKDAAAEQVRQAVAAANAKAAADAAAAKAAQDAANAQALADLANAAAQPMPEARPYTGPYTTGPSATRNLQETAMAAAIAQAKADQKAADAAEAQAAADAQAQAAQAAAANAQHASAAYHDMAATLPPLHPRIPTWVYVAVPLGLVGVGLLLVRRGAPKMNGYRRRKSRR